MTRKTTISLILFLSLGALAQNHPAMAGMTAHPARPIIDGSQNPELIPDTTAYRLYFETVAKMPADVQRAQLLAAGLSSEEIAPAGAAIQRFRSSWDALKDAYNQAVQAGMQPNREVFLSQRDRLVQQLLSDVQKAVTPDGFSHLQAHVQLEKQHMKVATVN